MKVIYTANELNAAIPVIVKFLGLTEKSGLTNEMILDKMRSEESASFDDAGNTTIEVPEKFVVGVYGLINKHFDTINSIVQPIASLLKVLKANLNVAAVEFKELVKTHRNK
jgi:hypothetical protein